MTWVSSFTKTACKDVGSYASSYIFPKVDEKIKMRWFLYEIKIKSFSK